VQIEAEPKKAIIAWISRDDPSIPEVMELCSSAGYEIVGEVRQSRRYPDSQYYVGRGKAREIVKEEGVEFLIIPSVISPPQVFNLSSVTKLVVIDRIRLILEIFRNRANTPESRLQVELADLHHQLPIVREYVHQGKLSEKPGFMAGGEYQVDYYYDMIRRQMTTIKDELEQIQKRRGEARAKRRRRGSYLIAIAGYTNAGKSTLMNALIEEGPGDKMQESSPEVFTTLSTSTRRMKGGKNRLLIDTVGFISDLPPFLIQGFMATMEEVFDSDIVVLVVDGSDPPDMVRRKLSDSMTILREGHTRGKVIIALNKIDRIDRTEIHSKLSMEDAAGAGDPLVVSVVPVSALSGEGLDRLVNAVDECLPSVTTVIAEFDPGLSISMIRKELGRRYDVEFVSSSGTANRFKIDTDARWLSPLLEKIVSSKGIVVSQESDE
jgi:GTP-binding protein HflX